MKIDDSIYYTPHQMASFFSIKKDTLLFYDRIGLLTPALRKSNGYRCYSASQINELDTILTLKDLGIPLASIKEAIGSISTPSFLSLLENEEASIRKKMDDCRFRLGIIRASKSAINDAITKEKEKLYTGKSGRIPIIRVPIKKIGKESTSDDAWQEAYSSLIAKVVCNAIITEGSIVPMEDARKTYGNICREVYATFAGPSDTCIAEGMYAYMYFQGSLGNLQSFYRKFLSALDDAGIMAGEEIYEELTISPIVTKEEKEHVTKLMVRIQNP